MSVRLISLIPHPFSSPLKSISFQELQQKINELEAELGRSHEKNNNIEIERDQLREMCQELGQDITEKENEVAEHLARVDSLTKENEKLAQDGAEVPSLREELARVSAELKQSQEMQQLMQASVSKLC